jgi:hypothetical protein
MVECLNRHFSVLEIFEKKLKIFFRNDPCEWCRVIGSFLNSNLNWKYDGMYYLFLIILLVKNRNRVFERRHFQWPRAVCFSCTNRRVRSTPRLE